MEFKIRITNNNFNLSFPSVTVNVWCKHVFIISQVEVLHENAFYAQ
jgi:hypothetical protein